MRFYKHNLFTLFIAVEMWNIVYNIFLYIFKFEEVNMSIVIADLLFFQQVQMSHMWYMPMILGIYVAVPFVAYYIKSFH
ncbi:acyltransferase family protein [uncultured Clostridium sp.]|uniref:acyltransferase family protein n=1 Tax=uncultured Clostridium sp. TaxID=59620 RepID=UPI00344C6256